MRFTYTVEFEAEDDDDAYAQAFGGDTFEGAHDKFSSIHREALQRDTGEEVDP